MSGDGDRLLRLSLRLGAAYDLVLGLVIVVAGVPTLRALGHPPEDPFLFRLAALPLFILPALYGSAAVARETRPFRAPVLWSRGGGGILILALVHLHRPSPAWIYLAVGLVDLAWAALHASLWRRR